MPSIASSFLNIRDGSLSINPAQANDRITHPADDWLWAHTALFSFTAMCWLVWLIRTQKSSSSNSKSSTDLPQPPPPDDEACKILRDPRCQLKVHYGEQIYHLFFIVAVLTGAVSYFTTASDLGCVAIRQYIRPEGAMTGHGHEPHTRQVFYVRYIFWFIAWPSILTATSLFGGISRSMIVFAVALQEFWIVCWLCGSLVSSSYRWGYFAFGMFAYVTLSVTMLVWGPATASRRSCLVEYRCFAAYLCSLWLIYALAWGLDEGSNFLSVTGGVVFYGILDIFSVPAYGLGFLLLQRWWDRDRHRKREMVELVSSDEGVVN